MMAFVLCDSDTTYSYCSLKMKVLDRDHESGRRSTGSC